MKLVYMFKLNPRVISAFTSYIGISQSALTADVNTSVIL